MAGTKKSIRVKFAVYIRNNGDGSASAVFFASKDLAERAAEKDGERFCEDIETHEFGIDPDTEKIVSGI